MPATASSWCWLMPRPPVLPAHAGMARPGAASPCSQTVVDGDHQVIVAIGVSNQATSDAVRAQQPMLERIQANSSRLPKALIADDGYCSTANLAASTVRVSGHQGDRATGSGCQRADGPKIAVGRQVVDLRPGQDNRGAGVWPDQGRPGTVSLPIAGAGEGDWGMGADCHHPQPARAVPGIAGPGLRSS